MKRNMKYTMLFAWAVFALASCKKEDVSATHYDNKLYISATEYVDELLVKPTVSNLSREITVGIAKRESHDIAVNLRVAPELLNTYRNAYYNQEAVLLPENNYVFETSQTEIKAGSVKSTPLTIDFVNLSELNRDTCYVLPLTIASVDGAELLASARTQYYVFKGAALINVVADIANNKAWPDWKNPTPVTNMSRFTLEALIYPYAFKNQIATIMGIEGMFLLRLGDAGVPSNQLQVASSRNLTNADLRLETNQWYHVAVTFNRGSVIVYINGVQKLSGSCGKSSVNFGVAHSDEADGKPRCFWIGYSYNDDRYLDGRISEARIWNRVLTAEEIADPTHFYQVDPASDGLVSYWKFDEGAGATIKDYTQYGNDLTVSKTPKWVGVSLP